jgi:hypothetical protein
MRTAALLLVVGALAAGAATSSQAAAIRSCGSASIGPTAMGSSPLAGARCLLRAFRAHCTPAAFTLSLFGIDTVRTRVFTVERRSGGCRVAVATYFHIVPQPRRLLGTGYCRRLAGTAKSVVATGCAGGGLGRTVSLTALR